MVYHNIWSSQVFTLYQFLTTDPVSTEARCREFKSEPSWLMYHFHAAEKSAHASLHVTRKHVNTQCDMFMLKYCGNTKSPPTPGQIGGYYNFKYQ